MGAVILSLQSYPELGLITMNLLSELLSKCGLHQHHMGKQLRKLNAGRDYPRSGNRHHDCD